MASTGERDAELAQRACDGDRICRQLLPVLMATDGDLDGSVESLRLIDEKAGKLREIMNVLDPAAEGEGASHRLARGTLPAW